MDFLPMARGNGDDTMSTTDKVNILIVDDSPGNLLALEAVLDRLGENCIRAYSGTEALRQVLHNDFAVILLDAQMKQIDGFETAALIRQREKSADIPIIFVTAIDKNSAQVFRGYAAGAVDYVFKPFDPEVLRSKVKVFVNLYKKTREIQKQTQQLRESEERFALAVRGAADGLWDWDITNNKIYYSPRWKLMLGCKPQDVGDTPGEWFKRIVPEDCERVQTALDAHLEGLTEHFEIEHRMIHRDGSIRWMLCRGLAVRTSNGVAYRMAGSLSDVTRRKMAEEELVRNERLAAMGMTISNTAHSMKNILQAVNYGVMFVEMGIGENASEELAKSCGMLKSSVRRLNELIMNMLDFSKQRAAVRKEIECETLFDAVRQVLSIPAEQLGIRLEFHIDPDSQVFYNDFDRLLRALINLGTNALDAMDGPERVITFSATYRKRSDLPLEAADCFFAIDEQSDDALVIEVRDTGMGIPEEYRNRIFEAFFSTKDSKGTGLGLASVKEFVKEQRGAILVDSVSGRGTSFQLIFFESFPASVEEKTV